MGQAVTATVAALIWALGEQAAELDLCLDLGLAGLPEPELAAGQRILPGVHLGTPRPARQLLCVTGGLTRQTTQLQISPVHEPVTNRLAKA